MTDTSPQAAREVVLYTKEYDCAPCVEAKRFLEANGVSYLEKDVANKAYLTELVRQHRVMTVPVLVVDGKLVLGFEKQAYEAALGLSPG